MNRDTHPGSWLLDAFQEAGIDTHLLVRQLPVETARMLDFPDTITPDELNRVLNECQAQTGDTHFGLHLIETIDPTVLGIFVYLLLNAPTVGEFLALAERYYPIFYRGAVLEVTTEGRTCRVVYRRADIPKVPQRHDTEWTLGYFVHTIRSRLGVDWQPLRATFQESEPEDLHELVRVFGPNLYFERPENSFEIDAILLDTPLNDADPRLLQIIRDQADAVLQSFAATDNIEWHVRLLIMKDLEFGSPDAAHIAHQLGMSLSTFKRRLSRKNLTFRTLRDAVISELAKKALAETNVNISLIAMRLGYSEVSAFNHAFSRLVGQSPGSYRRQVRRT